MTTEQIAIIGASLQFTRAYYQTKISTPAGDLYGDNATAMRANHDAEKALAEMIKREARLVAALAACVHPMADDDDADDARAVLAEVIQ